MKEEDQTASRIIPNNQNNSNTLVHITKERNTPKEYKKPMRQLFPKDLLTNTGGQVNNNNYY